MSWHSEMNGISTPNSTQNTAAQLPRQTHSVSSQRLKKREYDRKAQRVAREKTKNRLAHLETLVEKLSHQDDNATTASLVAQLSKVTEQRNKLMRCLASTSSIFNTHVKEAQTWDSAESPCGAFPQPQSSSTEPVSHKMPSPGPSTTPAPPSISAEQKHTGNCTESIVWEEMDSLSCGNVLDLSQPWNDDMFQTDLEAMTPSAVMREPPDLSGKPALSNDEISIATNGWRPMENCDCSSSTRTRRLSDGSQVSCNNWKAANGILQEPLAPPNAVLNSEDETSEDVPVHAVIHGWDSVVYSGRMTPFWRKVRQLDELCFSACGQTERLAVLFIVHLLMRAYADPALVKASVVPPWYLKSPLQEISHEPPADYFAWPALRYRFATMPHRYCGNMFWHMFKEHFRMAWPFDFRDCYVRNIQLGAYGLSPLFKEKLHDLRSWTMEPDFFARFPELRQDIPKFPGQTSPTNIYHFASNRSLPGSPEMDVFLSGADMSPNLKDKSQEDPERSAVALRKEYCRPNPDTRVSSLFLGELNVEYDPLCPGL